MFNYLNFIIMTINDFYKLREWILKGNSCHVFNSECGLIMWLLRASKVRCEWAVFDNETCVIYPHVGF